MKIPSRTLHPFFLVVFIFMILIFLIFQTRTTREREYFCKDCNVILVVITPLRADHLGSYGYQKNVSPNIDEFAKENILFNNFYSHITYTIASEPSIFTGLYPFNHKVYTANDSLDISLYTLPRVMHAYGYATAAIVGHHLLQQKYLGNHFDYYTVPPICPPGQLIGDNCNRDRRSEKTIPDAENWINENMKKKFFLYIESADVHCPTPFGEADPDTAYNLCDFNLNAGNISTSLLSDAMGTYDKNIEKVDLNFNNLLLFLKNKGLYNNTIIIFMGDHGEAFGEHGEFAHPTPPYAEQVRVPFIIHIPGFGPEIMNNQAQIVDVMPTILNILNMTIPQDVDGKSLVPMMLNNNTPIDAYTYSEFQGRNFTFAFRNNSLEILFSGNRYELYNLTCDRSEKNDIFQSHKTIGFSMLQAMQEWKNKTQKQITIEPTISPHLIGYP